MTEQRMIRASGKTASEEETEAKSKEFETLSQATLPEEESRKWKSPGFQRMRMDWRSEDRTVMDRAKGAVDGWMQREFADAYRLLYQVFSQVREQEVNADGELVVDHLGNPVWRRDENGQFVEDFNRLTIKDKENFMFSLTTRLVFWEQRAADAWGEAMFSKAMWEESYAVGYDAPRSGTVDNRNAKATIDSREDRYFAILLTYRSRKADALVRSLALLSQRLKDSMMS